MAAKPKVICCLIFLNVKPVCSSSPLSKTAKSWQRFDMYRQQLADIEQQLEQAAANIARAPEDEQLMDLFTALRDLDHKRENSGKIPLSAGRG